MRKIGLLWSQFGKVWQRGDGMPRCAKIKKQYGKLFNSSEGDKGTVLLS